MSGFENFLETQVGDFGLWQQTLLLGVGLAMLPSAIYLPTFMNFLPEQFQCRIDICEHVDLRHHSFAFDEQNNCNFFGPIHNQWEEMSELKQVTHSSTTTTATTSTTKTFGRSSTTTPSTTSRASSTTTKWMTTATSVLTEPWSTSITTASSSTSTTSSTSETSNTSSTTASTTTVTSSSATSTTTAPTAASATASSSLLSGLCSASNFNSSILHQCHRSRYSSSILRHSLTADFDLGPCSSLDPEWLPGKALSKQAFLQSVFWLGLMIGSALLGPLADTFGGRKVLVHALSVLALTSILAGISTNFWLYVLASFLIGATSNAGYTIGFVYMAEIVSKSRFKYLLLLQNFRVLGALIFVLVALSTSHWRALYIICAILNLIALYPWLKVFEESPRWLLSKTRFQEAEQVLIRAAEINGRHVEKEPMDELVMANCVTVDLVNFANDYHDLEPNELANMQKLRKKAERLFTGTTLLFALVLFALWFSNLLSFFGLMFLSSDLAFGDFYLNVAVLAMADVPATILASLTIDKFGRKPLMVALQVITGLLLVSSVVVSANKWAALAAVFAAKVSTGMSGAVLVLYTSELFPTAMRNSMMGAASAFGRLGALLAAWITAAKGIHANVDLVLFALISVLTAVMVLVSLPETLGAKLPESALDMDKLNEDHNDSVYVEYLVKKCDLIVAKIRAVVGLDKEDDEQTLVNNIVTQNSNDNSQVVNV